LNTTKNLNGVKKLKDIENELINREWRTKINIFINQLGIDKQVQVYLSTYVKEPLTFGHFRPVILLPISLITGFDSKAIETIILHELAHIKRHDYLVNLGQSIVEIILFYHPLVWWLSKEIRTVREHCCDDLVLAMGDNRNTYVETLTALQWRKAGVSPNRLSMTSIGDSGNFSQRIKRMFGEEEKHFSTQKWVVLLGLVGLLIGGKVWMNQQKNISEERLDKKEIIFLVDENTSQALFQKWETITKKRGINLDFSPSVFDENNQLKEVRGSYSFDDNSGDFFATDLPCTNMSFALIGNHLSRPTFLYPCREKAAAEMGNIFQINSETKRMDLIVWAMKLAKQDIEFNFDNSVFDSEGKLLEFNVNYKDEYSRGSFAATDMTCSKFYYELVEQTLVGPTFLKEGETPTTLENKNVTPINLINDEGTGKLGFSIYKGMPSKEFFKQIANFQDLTGAEIIFDEMTLYQDNMVVGSIKGKIQPNRDEQQIYYFDIHDLEKYTLQLTGTTNQIFPPTYIDNATTQVIRSKETAGGEKSIFTANRKTTKAELANWSKSILKHGVLFNYEKSVFDEKDQLIGLNGKFMGKCCYDDEFYINVEEAQVQLEIEDDYIYQPTIIKNELSSTFDLEQEFEEKFASMTIAQNELSKEAKAKFVKINEKINNKSNGIVKTVIPRKDEQLQDNWIYWGDKKIPLEGSAEKVDIPKLEFTKTEWAYLRKQPLTFQIAEEWFKIQGMYAVVLVPKKKNPVLVNIHKDYYQLVKDENERVTRLMASADVGDMLYFEKIDVGKDFFLDLVIKIIEDPIDKSTGYHPSKDQDLNKNIEIDFQEAEIDFSKGFIPAYQNSTQPSTFNPTFLEAVNRPNFTGRLKRGVKINNKPTFVNGVKFDVSWMSDILPENIESINVVKGVKARTLYGVEEAILITTKKGTSSFLGASGKVKKETPKKN